MRLQVKSQHPTRSFSYKFDFEPTEVEKHRSNIRLILECSNATPIRTHTGLGYSCNFCPDQYLEPWDLKSHILEVHNLKIRRECMDYTSLYCFSVKLDITWLFCTICDISVDNLDDLIAHLVGEHKKTYYTDINSRIIPFKFEDDTLRCALCLNVFSRFKALLEHMNTHTRNFVCDECDAAYVTANMLRMHKQTHKKGHFPCNLCKKVFDTQRKASCHEKAYHRYRYRVNKCGICKERFNGFFVKQKHMAEVHGVVAPKLKCQACDKVFDNKKGLTIHTKRDHLLERPHKCEYCEKSFYHSKSLKEHLTKHATVKQYHCDICKKSYVRKTTLREHMRAHNDDRRFECEYCGERFLQKVSYRRHIRSKHEIDA